MKYPDTSNTGAAYTDIDSDSSDVVSYSYDTTGAVIRQKDQLTYDRNSNIATSVDGVFVSAASKRLHDALYTIDSLNRLWACDFVQQRTLTLKGFRDAYLLVFVNVATRQAVATTSTEHPNAAWVAAQVPLFQAAAGGGATECRVLTRDSDTKFGRAFDGALRSQNITPVRLPHCAPNLNAHVERFIQTVQVECLDRFIVMGTRHLDHLMAEYIEHYNTERPHSAIGFATPLGRRPPARARTVDPRDIRCRERLGGVLKHYYRKAA